MENREVVILGGGLAGMSAARVLGNRAVVLEANERPGGLVRSQCFDEYWFDHVLHILHFDDHETERIVFDILGKDMVLNPPKAWVKTAKGTARFPFQFHLGNLDNETTISCLSELAELAYSSRYIQPQNFDETLISMFGTTMCEVFHRPYNRKMWKRSLAELAPQGFTWNIQPGDFEKALRGALIPDTVFASYNARAWYPKARPDENIRGIELLSHRLSRQVDDIRILHQVTEVDLHHRTVTAETPKGKEVFQYNIGCCSTIPLPNLLRMCRQTPQWIRKSLHQIKRNRIITIALSIRGPRPENGVHWWYFAEENICFTRLVFTHEFDPLMAPPDGWGLMSKSQSKRNGLRLIVTS